MRRWRPPGNHRTHKPLRTVHTSFATTTTTVAAVALAVLIGVGLIVGLSVGAKKVSAAPYECRTPAGAAYDATFFVIGDWGRRGNGGQRAAARMMADVARCMAPDFILSTGDNFYDREGPPPLLRESLPFLSFP